MFVLFKDFLLVSMLGEFSVNTSTFEMHPLRHAFAMAPATVVAWGVGVYCE